MMVDKTNHNTTTYRPPKQLQSEQIWSLGLQDKFIQQFKKDHKSRSGKLSEFNFSKKKAPLLSFQGQARRLQKQPDKFSGIFGIVSRDILTIDIDKVTRIPDYITSLLEKHPTFCHPSKSGNGFHLYYHAPNIIPKKVRKFKDGELIQGIFVTTNDPADSDFSDEHIASITKDELAEFIPEINKDLQPRSVQRQTKDIYFDPDKMLNEARQYLKKLPSDPDPIIEFVFDSILKDMELNSYTYWLTVCQSLTHLAAILSPISPGIEDEIAEIFHTWSSTGQGYIGQDDCNEKFYDNFNSTKDNTDFIITFDTLRKIAFNYKTPVNEFPKLKYDKKGNVVGPDQTDPRNYIFLTKKFKLRMVQSESNTYIQGPASIIKYYFKDANYYFLTDKRDDISVPFDLNFKADDSLYNRLIVFFREQGIKNCSRSPILLAGFHDVGITKTDLIYLWITSKPWDKVPRIDEIIGKSLTLDKAFLQEAGIEESFYYSLIKKHLVHIAGLRAKAYRTLTNERNVDDNYKRAQSILIIKGYQRKGKTTWVESLVPFEANCSISVTPDTVKNTLEMQRALQSAFIYNIDEVDVVFNKMDPAEIKSVITQEKDSFRTMYKQGTKSHIRRSGFFGTTNANALKLDKTGNRRVWIIPTKDCNATPFFDCDYQQVWAELLYEAEQLTGKDWSINDYEEMLINHTASFFAKQTTGSRTLDLLFTGQDGDYSLYTHEEIDFRLLFNDLKQLAWRGLTNKCLFAQRGQKAYKHLSTAAALSDIQLKLSSFNYDFADYTASILGWENKTIEFTSGHMYSDGVFKIQTRPNKLSSYHFIPYKVHIDALIEEGIIDAGILKITEK